VALRQACLWNDRGETGRATPERNHGPRLPSIRGFLFFFFFFFPFFSPAAHNNPEGGMVFPKFAIDKSKKQEDRDPQRSIWDFDLPDQFSARISARFPDHGGSGRCIAGKIVTIENSTILINGILNPKQLEGLRRPDALPAAAVQSGLKTGDPRARAAAWRASTVMPTATPTPAFNLVGDIRPRSSGIEFGTTSLRGRQYRALLFGSQRGMRRSRTSRIRAARGLFDGGTRDRYQKGVNTIERGARFTSWRSFQEILDFTPAPKIRYLAEKARCGKKPSSSECAARPLLFGKAQCAVVTAPYYDNLMHNPARALLQPAWSTAYGIRHGPSRRSLCADQSSPPICMDGRCSQPGRYGRVLQYDSTAQAQESGESGPCAFLRAL